MITPLVPALMIAVLTLRKLILRKTVPLFTSQFVVVIILPIQTNVLLTQLVCKVPAPGHVHRLIAMTLNM